MEMNGSESIPTPTPKKQVIKPREDYISDVVP